MLENLALELPERLARLEPELGGKVLPAVLVHLQRLPLATGPVQRHHQLTAKALAERMALDERLELADQLVVASEREVGVDPLLERGQAELLEASDLRLGERLVREVGKGRPAPERQRVTEPIGCQLRVVPAERLSSLLDPALEDGGVERLGSDAQDVSVTVRFEPRGRRLAFRVRERLPEPRDVRFDVFAAVAGGDSPQRSSMSASCETTSFARRSSAANSARCLGPPRSSLRPSSTTSSGPRIRNSIARLTPLRPRTDSFERAARRTVQPTVAGLQPIRNPRAAASLHRPPRGRSPNGGGAMLHRIVTKLTTGAAVALTALVATTGAMAADAVVRPDDRAAHGPGAIAAAQRDVVLRPDDRAERGLPNDAPVAQPTTTEGFDWVDAGIGAAATLGLVLLVAGASVMRLRQQTRHERPARGRPVRPPHPTSEWEDVKLLAIIGIAALSIAGTAVAALTASAWTTAQKIDTVGGNNSEVNTPSLDGCPIQSPDGLSLYIASNRPGGKGGLDIWGGHPRERNCALGCPAEPGRAPDPAADDFCPTPVEGGLFIRAATRSSATIALGGLAEPGRAPPTRPDERGLGRGRRQRKLPGACGQGADVPHRSGAGARVDPSRCQRAEREPTSQDRPRRRARGRARSSRAGTPGTQGSGAASRRPSSAVAAPRRRLRGPRRRDRGRAQREPAPLGRAPAPRDAVDVYVRDSIKRQGHAATTRRACRGWRARRDCRGGPAVPYPFGCASARHPGPPPPRPAHLRHRPLQLPLRLLHAAAIFGRDYPFLHRSEILSFEEIARVARTLRRARRAEAAPDRRRAAAARGLERLVAMLAGDPAADLTMTTNGSLLARKRRAPRRRARRASP